MLDVRGGGGKCSGREDVEGKGDKQRYGMLG